jgi:hypothetical protein
MLHDGDGVDGLRANGVRSEIGFQVVLRKGVEPDARVIWGIVNANQQTKFIDFSPCVLFLGKIAH